MSEPLIFACGDSALNVEFSSRISPEANARVCALAQSLEQEPVFGITEWIPTFRSLLIAYDPSLTDFRTLRDAVARRLPGLTISENRTRRIIEIPVLYGGEAGPDLPDVAEAVHMTEQEVISRHCQPDYPIAMLGFLPGFPYLSGLDPALTVPRLKTPRLKIPAGSVAIGGSQTGIYPIDSPGGWRIIGSTPIPLFDPSRVSPILYQAGDALRFCPVTPEQYRSIQRQAQDGELSLTVWESGVPSRVLFPRKETVQPDSPSSGGFRVRGGGLLTTVQDEGQTGYQKFGFPASGAMDKLSYRRANLLLGNRPGEAALEMTLLGAELEFTAPNVIALTGAEMSPRLNGAPIPSNAAVAVKAGDILSCGTARNGLRTYLAFAGGLNLPPLNGSCSTILKCGVGGYQGRSLRAGDELSFRSPVEYLPFLPSRRLAPVSFPSAFTLRVVLPEPLSGFTEKGLETFFGSEYTVTPESDRMGCRLDGPAVELENGADIVSDGIAFGAIQIPSHGKPMILMADRQTTGGYLKIGTVASADLPLLAQAPAGSKIRFSPVSVEQARRLLLEQAEQLRREEDSLCQPEQYTVFLNGKQYEIEIRKDSAEILKEE